MNKIYDVAVIGAGPGGSATASYLAKTGACVLLLDKAEFPRDKTCGDAVSPKAIQIINDLGLLNDLKGFGYRINKVRLVAPNGNQLVAPIPAQTGLTEYLYIAPRFELDNLLLRNAISQGAQFKSKVRVTDIQVEPDKIRILGENGRNSVRFSAKVGVIAVGANIALLRKLGLMSKTPDFAVATRAYFEDLTDMDDMMEIRFDGVPLPGYGWIFPTSKTSANIGAGFLQNSKKITATAREILDKFLQHGPVRERMSKAQVEGPIKGFPLRMDFATARSYQERIILVGESVGLVNPFTGEGIDYALESGQIAAGVLETLLQQGDFSARALSAYDRKLRKRFQRLFVWTMRMRSLYMNERLLNPLVAAARTERYVEKVILEVLLSYRNAIQALSPRTLFHVVRNWAS